MSLNLVQRIFEERITGVIIRKSQRHIPFFGYNTFYEVYDGKHVHHVAIPGYQDTPSYSDRVEMFRNWWTRDTIYELRPYTIPPSNGVVGDGRKTILYKLIDGYRILPRDTVVVFNH